MKHLHRRSVREPQRRGCTERQIAAVCQLGDTVHQGPRGQRVRHGIALRDHSGVLGGNDAVQKDAEGVLAKLFVLALFAECDGQVKHDGEMIGPVQREVDVAATCQGEALGRRLASDEVPLHGYGEAIEPLGGDGDQQLVFAGEVAIRRVVGNPSPASDLAEREYSRANFADERDCSVEQSLAQIAVVVGL